jgi:hypothetical protein
MITEFGYRVRIALDGTLTEFGTPGTPDAITNGLMARCGLRTLDTGRKSDV